MRLAVTLCLTGLALVARGDDVSRVDSVNIMELQQSADQNIAQLKKLAESSALGNGPAAFIAGLVAANAQASLDVARGMVTIEQDLTMNKIANAQVAANVAEHKQTIQASKSTIDTNIESADSEMKKAGNAAKVKAQAEIAKAKAAVTKAVSTKITAETSKITAALPAYADSRRYLFSGGDAGDGGRGSWRDFVVSRTEIDTARPYFQLRTSTRFRALKTGVFHILFWSIQRGGRCHQHNRIRYAGGSWLHEHNHNWLTDGNWEGDTLNLNWKFNANKDFWTTHYNTCGVRWHARPGNVNDANAYNRIFVEYMGSMASTWNGPQ